MTDDAFIRVDLKEGACEIRGSEEFVSTQAVRFESLIQQILERGGLPHDDREPKQPDAPKEAASSRTAPKKRRSKKKAKTATPKEPVGIVKDLDLRPDGKASFADFVDEKGPRSNIEFTTIAIYYLERVLGLSAITAAHVNTCYSDAKRRPPANIKGNLWDASGSRYAYIDASDSANLKVAQRGLVLVEHDLPRGAD